MAQKRTNPLNHLYLRPLPANQPCRMQWRSKGMGTLIQPSLAEHFLLPPYPSPFKR